MPVNKLVEAVWKAGVVGAGGAGFPTWKKIDARVETVVVNGAECEPLLRNDQQVMTIQASEIVRGLELVMKTTGARQGIIALKKKYTSAIKSLQKEIKDKPNLSLHYLQSVYPAGDEFVLVYETTGKVVPGGGIPLQVGVLVSNVETFYNISRAERGEPVTSRYLTVTGAVREPKTLKLPVGTPMKVAVDLAGGAAIADWTIVTGGPMMGEVVGNPDQPITKTTSSVIVLPPDHPVVTRKTRSLEFDLRTIQAICCQCVYCTLICPRTLIGHNFKPHIVMRSLSLGLPFPESPGFSSAPFCCDCDLCGVYSCPMNLPIGRLNKQIAAQMKNWAWESVPPPEEYSPSPLREYRLIPVSRLTARLRLEEYDQPAPFDDLEVTVKRVKIPLKQHIGKPASPVVKKNQRVKTGQIIGEIARGTIGARVHASLAGIVKEVNENFVVISAS